VNHWLLTYYYAVPASSTDTAELLIEMQRAESFRFENIALEIKDNSIIAG
jgi:hypothetical protein